MKVFNSAKFIFALLLAFSVCVSAQEKNEAENRVFFDVSVFNYEKEIVKNLKRENFLLYENNKPVEISSFSNENLPISVGILIDSSQSMGAGNVIPRKAMLDFLANSNPKNEYFVAAFNNEVKRLSDFADAEKTRNIVASDPYFSISQKAGSTVLFDAAKFGIENLLKSKNRKKVLFIIWDESDKYASGSFKELEKLAKEKHIVIYPVSGRSDYSPFPTTNFDLEKLAEISVGKSVYYEGGRNILYRSKFYSSEEIFTSKFLGLAEELQNQYAISFKPSMKNGENKWRKIEVRLEIQKELRKQIGTTTVLHRKGYYPLFNVVTDNQL